MQWEQIVLIALFTINSLGVVGAIGKAREPYTPGNAIAVIIINTLLIILILRIGN